MANNVNNGITGVIDIPGALRSRGAADGNLVGGVVAYAGDIYDTTFGKNQSQINQEFSDSLSSSENANTSRPIKLYLTGNNSEYSVCINYAEGAYEEGFGPVFADTCVDEYLLDSDTLEQVAQITNITSSEGTITITTDNNLGQLEDALYVLLSVEGTGSIDSGSFVNKAENGVIYGNTIFNAEGSEEAVLVGSDVSNDGSYSTVVGGANFNNGNDSTIIGNDNTNASEKNTIIGYGNSSSESRSSVLIGHNLSLTDGMGVRLGNYNVEISPNNYFAVSGRINRVNQNILEQHTDGSLYIKGLGGFDGTNSTTTGIKSLQGVISDIESNSSSSSSSYTHPSTHPASMITYDASTLYESGNIGYAIKALQTAISGVPTYSAGTGISISNNTISVDATQLSYNDLLDKLVRDVNYSEGIIISGLTLLPCNIVGGTNSVAMGAGATVTDSYGGIAAGYITLAKGWGACANGAFTYAEGSGTHVEGKGLMDSTAIIRESYTQGNTDIVVNQAFPVGAIILNKDRSAILCYVTNCEEYGNYYKLTLSAGLDQNLSTGKNIPIIGYAKGIGAHAEGCGTIAKGDGTHAEGMYTVTNNNAEHACGKYNKSTPEVRIPGNANVSSYGTQFSIGVGSSYTQRANAFEVLGNGDIYVKGLGSYDGTSISNVSTLLNVITGINTRVTTLENSSSSQGGGSGTSSYNNLTDKPLFQRTGEDGWVLGDITDQDCPHAYDENSFAEGWGTIAGDSREEYDGYAAHAEGDRTQAKGVGSHSEGVLTQALLAASHAEGNYTIANGAFTHAEGSHTQATATASHAEGEYTQTTNTAEHASGRYNLSNDLFVNSTSYTTRFSIGIGTSENARMNAFEVLEDGDVYIKGIGSYTGDNLGQSGVKSVQLVIAELTLQIAALTNN